jgi:ABC-type branched-subunit amino acid transport system ATPase component/ABC-type branched-subunit amino acid transport system permease subunit
VTEILQFALLGISTGSLYALVSIGIVAVYRASGVLNFAAGATGAVGAFAFYNLRDQYHVNWMVALVVALIIGGVVGGLTHFLVIDLLRTASSLAKVIGTLGVMSVVLGLLVVRYGAGSPVQPTSPLPATLWHLGNIVISSDRVIIIAIAIGLAIALWLVYAKTPFGLATSAVAESRTMAAASGIACSAVERANFVLAGAVSALAAMLMAPIIGLDAATLALGLIFPALAAALVGRFSSFAWTVVSALVIGALQSEAERYQANVAGWIHWSSLQGLDTTIPLLIVVVVVVARGRTRSSRGDESNQLPLPGNGLISPVGLLITAGAGLIMLFVLDTAWQAALTTSFAWGLVILSVVVLTGFTGQLSLGQIAVAGFGAWVAGRLYATEGLPFELVLVLGMLAAVPVGLVVAIPALRTRGVDLAIVTLGLGMAIQALILNNTSLTGGLNGTTVSNPKVFGISVDPIYHPQRFGAVALVLFVVAGLGVANLRRGRAGRRLLAVRSNERAAASLGIGVYGAKLYAFGLAAAIAGVGGVLIAFQSSNVQYAEQFDVFGSIQVVQFTVMGGLAFATGAIGGSFLVVGGIFSQILSSLFDANQWLLVIGGVGVLLTLRSAPEGLAALNAHLLHPVAKRLGQIGTKSASIPEPRLPREAVEVEVRDVTMRFGGITALSKVSFSVRPGEIVGLIGPNGAGKTTLLDIVTGFTRPTEGSIFLNGTDITRWSPEKRARARVARSFQAVELFGELTVRENLLVAADRQRGRRYVYDLIHPGRLPVSQVVEELIEDFGLGDVLHKRPSDLSYGMTRLVGIARAIATEPSVLFLDEPAAGLDPGEREELGREIERIAKDRGIAVVLVEHDVPLVMRVCERVLVLDFGRKIAEGLPGQVASDPAVVAAYLGDEAPKTEEAA